MNQMGNFWFGCYRIYIILLGNSNIYCFSFILHLILHHLAALAPLPVDCLSIMTHDWLVFYSSLNFENFRYLYSGIVSCKLVMGYIESNLILNRNESNFLLANRPSLLCMTVHVSCVCVLMRSLRRRWLWRLMSLWLLATVTSSIRNCLPKCQSTVVTLSFYCLLVFLEKNATPPFP